MDSLLTQDFHLIDTDLFGTDLPTGHDFMMCCGCAGPAEDVALGGLSKEYFTELGEHQWVDLPPLEPHPEDAVALQELEYKISVCTPVFEPIITLSDFMSMPERSWLVKLLRGSLSNSRKLRCLGSKCNLTCRSIMLLCFETFASLSVHAISWDETTAYPVLTDTFNHADGKGGARPRCGSA